MNQDAVYRLFVSTYHPIPSVHKQAELNIRNIESQPGFLPLVLQIQASENLELGARQAAAIYFKNRIQKAWDESKGITITPEDRSIIKQNILLALTTAPAAVQVQLAASLNSILTCDFPEKWPTFINELESFMISEEIRIVHVGLIALREVVKVFQWKSMDRREPLRQIIKLTFPAINAICHKLINLDTDEAAEMLKLALKIYHSSIQVDLPKCLQDPASLVPWGSLFVQLVDKKIPEQVLPEDPEEREQFIWWKTKKWAYHCLNRLFGKYGNPAMLAPSSTKYTHFAKSFAVNFAPNILQTYLQQIDGWIKKEHWMSNKCLALSAAFFDDSIKHKTTWKIIKPYTDILVAQFIFPQLCFSAEDEQLWSEEPIEYVHKKIDPFEDFHSTRDNATTLLIDLARDRKKHTFMSILGFINDVLNRYMETPDNQKNGRDKDGALCMIGALSSVILGNKSEVANMMEPFFEAHVFPEFRSRFPYLRARACDITRHFSDLDFSNEENTLTVYRSVLNCLRDKELPVRVQAALALQPMIRHESVREAMGPNLLFIMQEFLDMTNEIDNDILSGVMGEFVEVFAEQLTPFAVQLCTQLRDTFLRIMEELAATYQGATDDNDFEGDSEESSDKTMAAMGVLKTIGTLILSLESTPEILQQLQEALLPVITYTLEKRIIDLYDEIFEIIDSCTFSSKHVTPIMWGVFDLMYSAFKDSGVDFMHEMLPAFTNFVTYGNEVFIQNDQVKQMMFDIIDTVMKSDHLGENDRIQACRLMESILLNCRGSVDVFVAPFLNLAFQYIFTGQMKTTEFKVHCIEVVVNCLYYNPALTLSILEENQWTQGFFTLWLSTLDKFSRVHDKKLVIVTLCTLLSLPADKIPPSLLPGWPQLLTSVSHVFQSLPKAMENRENMEQLYSGEIEEDEDEEDGEEDDEEEEDEDEDDVSIIEEESEEENEENEDDDIQDEDTEYLEYLNQQIANQNNGEIDANDDEEDDMAEEILFESPLDDIDPYICFEQVFRDLQQHNPEFYAHLTKNLNAEEQNNIMAILSLAEQTRNELAATQ
ncbi:hypothetical protein HPULCUR_000953 [Helicostylum pulchrum]|uniref:Importin N-terminal domain-containing protein n=1 Tax=Helicostylum pulchrum TaxID=562976 RepID=A0ABP9XNF2_9FUNG